MNDDAEELLRESLDQLTAEARLPAGFADQVRRRVHQRRRWTRVTQYTGAAGAVAVAAAVAVTLTTGSASVPHVSADAFVVSHVTSALAAPGQAADVVYTQSVEPGGLEAIGWSDQTAFRTELTTGKNSLNQDIGYRLAGAKYAVTTVYYPGKAWWQSEQSAGFVAPPGVAEQLALVRCHTSQSAVLTRFEWSAFIRDMLTCGSFRIVGHTQLGGVSVLELAGHTGSQTIANASAKVHGTVSIAEMLWVNASTYLPVHLIWTMNSSVSHQSLGHSIHETGANSVRTDFKWLPPTPANLAKLNVQIPQGFRKISQ